MVVLYPVPISRLPLGQAASGAVLKSAESATLDVVTTRKPVTAAEAGADATTSAVAATPPTTDIRRTDPIRPHARAIDIRSPFPGAAAGKANAGRLGERDRANDISVAQPDRDHAAVP
nr:hypothetical protein GCM10020092_004000 [Actinoplanes digitatis]